MVVSENYRCSLQLGSRNQNHVKGMGGGGARRETLLALFKGLYFI